MNRIPISMPIFNGNEKKYLNECIDTGWVSANGHFITDFESKFAEFCGSKYAVACSNGTTALHLAIECLDIGPGDEVIMPTFTYIATANAVAYSGAKPVFVDVEPHTWNIDPDKIEDAITPRTKAILPVHIYGLPANMDNIIDIAKKYNLYVIEDAAEAHGAKWGDKSVGAIGNIGSFSFFGNKIITCGEGGMLVTNNELFSNKMKFLRSQGVDPNRKYWHLSLAYNYRMTNMQAAIGLGQLEQVSWHMNERQRVASLYKNNLSDYGDLFSMQAIPEKASPSYWMFTIKLSDKVKCERDVVMDRMEKNNIEMRPAFYPMHVMPPYYDASLSFPIAEEISKRSINLPSHANLTEEHINYIVKSLIDSCSY